MVLATAAQAAGGYEIEQSLRFSGDEFISRQNPASTATSTTTFTHSFWFKRGSLGSTQQLAYWVQGGTAQQTFIAFDSSDRLNVFYEGSAGASVGHSYSTARYRDLSAWYHVVWATDTTQAISTNRWKLWVNGEQVTTWDSVAYPSQNLVLPVNHTGRGFGHGTRYGNEDQLFSGYIAESYFVDGQFLDHEDFGEYDDNGVWRPIAYSGTYGARGWYLPFAASDIYSDESGNNQDFAPYTGYVHDTSGTGTDVMSDTPTNNFATINPLTNISGLSGTISNLSDGNLYHNGNGNTTLPTTLAIPAGTGKWYWEVTPSNQIASSDWVFGVQRADLNRANYTSWNDTRSNGVFVNTNNNNTTWIYGSSSTTTAWTVANGDVVGVAFDASTGNISYYKNGTLQVTLSAAVNTSYPHYPAGSGYFSAEYLTWNFGQRAFEQTVPSGYKALNTANLPAPDIADGSDYFAPLVGPGDTETAWSETNTAVSVSGGQLTTYDGLANTEHLLGRTDTKYPPVDFIRSLRELELDGYNDWYLGSQYEMEVVYYNLKPTTDNNTTVSSAQDNAYSVPQRTTANYTTTVPGQTSVTAFQAGGAQAFDSETSGAFTYYTSSAPSTNAANGKSFTAAGIAAGYNYNSGQKYSEYGITRAMRRVAYTGSEPSIGSAYQGGYYAGLYSLNGDGTATHALIVADKANGENTGMRALAQQKFSNGLYWIKDRQVSASHKLIDSVRGVTNQLSSDGTASETTYSDPDNASVAWNWLAASGTEALDTGSINSTVSANPSAGFSIVSYTGNTTAGATVGHGLGVAPSFIFLKNKDSGTQPWRVYHSSLGATKALRLNDDISAETDSAFWNNTAPSSTVVTLGNDNSTNATGDDYIAYCFAEVEGYSNFGSYTGNGNSSNDGPFVYLGFKPAVLIFKRSSSGSSSWYIFDAERDAYNPSNKALFPSFTTSETSLGTNATIDFLSNGFKLRCGINYTDLNNSGDTYVYAAFASNPFGGEGVSPATAR
jgi:hypothetical protein